MSKGLQILTLQDDKRWDKNGYIAASRPLRPAIASQSNWRRIYWSYSDEDCSQVHKSTMMMYHSFHYDEKSMKKSRDASSYVTIW